MAFFNGYYHWLMSFIIPTNGIFTYNRLTSYLFNRPFVYTLDMDENRYIDGVALRAKYDDNFDSRYLPAGQNYCNMLEMMVALAIRMEEDVMSNYTYGDRTSQWFYHMIDNLGLAVDDDDNFNINHVDRIMMHFDDRTYTRDGRGALFHNPERSEDMRRTEIWYQAMWYLNKFCEEE